MDCPDHQSWDQSNEACGYPHPPAKKVYTRLETPRAKQPLPVTPSPPVTHNQHIPADHHHHHQDSSKKNLGGINWPNPCSHPNIQYVPHPTNPQQYFKCHNGVLEGHTCNHGEVWIQPSHACINIQDRIPQTSTPNPCMNSQDRYHPYPGDMHRYIECVAWYKMQIWHCGEDAVWMQNKQTCVSIASQPAPTPAPPVRRPPVRPAMRPVVRPTMPPQTTAAPPTPVTNSATNFCTHSLSFYHAYKPDPEKFIQCDEYGNMFIRRCGPKKRWSDFYKTCTGHLNVVNETSFGNEGNSGSGAGESNSATGSATGIATEVGQPDTVNIAIESITYVEDIVQVDCPDYYEYDPQQNLCIWARNSIANDYNPYSPSCQDGFLWDTNLQMCVRAIRVNSSPTNARPGTVITASEYRNRPQVFPPNETPKPPVRERPVYIPPPTPPLPTIEVPEYDGPNPCLSGTNQYYFPYPNDNRFFLQCDATGSMPAVKACPPFTRYLKNSPDQYSCMDFFTKISRGQEGDTAVPGLDELDISTLLESLTAEEYEQINNCKIGSNTDTYQPFPFDTRYFIQCSNGRPMIMACNDGSVWNFMENTCVPEGSLVNEIDVDDDASGEDFL